VVDDFLHAEAGRGLGGFSYFLDVALLARPLRRGDREGALAEVIAVVLPASGRQPRPVNEDQRDLAVSVWLPSLLMVTSVGRLVLAAACRLD
jgi:hypothetical protein